MRPIKFRAWDKKTKKWVDSKNLYINSATGEAYTKYGELGKWDDDLVLMQFTGLLDKNGKEIYEGDILDCRSLNGNEHVYNYEVKIPDFFQEIWSKQGENVFVVGNIYENPELLKP